MSKASSAKRRIENQIIAALGSDSSYYPFLSNTQDEWGDDTVTYGTVQTIKTVPYSFIGLLKDNRPFGDVPKGSVMIAASADNNFNEKDKLVINGKTFYVQSIENFIMQGINIVKVLLLVERL